MMLPDEVLLDFDKDELADWDDERAQRLLIEQPEVYRNDLLIACHLHGWAERYSQRDYPSISAERRDAYCNALLDVAAFLRQGYYAPGGRFHNQELGDVPDPRRGRSLREIFPDLPDLDESD